MKKISYLILNNVVSIFAFAGLVGTGTVLLLLLPHRAGRHGMGWGRESASIEPGNTLMLLGRHEWGDLHLYLAILFIAAMLVHFVFHWSWIVAVFERAATQHGGLTKKLGITFGVLLVLFMACAPLLIYLVRLSGF